MTDGRTILCICAVASKKVIQLSASFPSVFAVFAACDPSKTFSWIIQYCKKKSHLLGSRSDDFAGIAALDVVVSVVVDVVFVVFVVFDGLRISREFKMTEDQFNKWIYKKKNICKAKILLFNGTQFEGI